MRAESYGAAQQKPSAFANARGGKAWRSWKIATSLLLVAIFLEAIFAGAILSGAPWALEAHRITAGLLVVAALGMALASFVILGRSSQGRRFPFILLSLAIAMILQAGAGMLAAKGDNLLWLHVPLGVALFGLARLAFDSARLPPGD